MLDVARLDCNNSTFNGRISLLFIPFTSFFLLLNILYLSGNLLNESSSSLPIVLFEVLLFPLFYFGDFVLTTKNILDMFNTSLAQKKNEIWKKVREKNELSRARFWSSDLWVMGPARFHCATLLPVRREAKLLIIKALLWWKKVTYCIIFVCVPCLHNFTFASLLCK